MSEDKQQPSNRPTSGPSIDTWGKAGGAVGFIVAFAFFGFGDTTGPGPGTVWSGFIKGALGGAIGAAIFAGLAAIIGARKK